MTRPPSRWRRLIAGTASAALLALGLTAVVGAATPAAADTAPPQGLPATVSGYALPTWQINGVGWTQQIVGNKVLVGGDFSAARPPGVAAGQPGEVPVSHFFAYDITTGNPVGGFNRPQFNGQVLTSALSKDGSVLYVGGDFTTVNGQPRGHIAAISTANGALLPFAPTTNGQVRAMSAGKDALYVGGTFWNANGSTRTNIAGFRYSDARATGLNARPDNYPVRSMVLSPDESKLIVGGQFLKMNGQDVYGMAALDVNTGGNLPWAANKTIRDYNQGGITSLNTDGTHIYGTTFAFGDGGTFEGPFVLNPSDGSIRWVADCLGDTYDAEISGGVVYTVGHAHHCTMIDSFPDTGPRVRWQRAMAMTVDATRTNKGPDPYGWNYSGVPAPTALHWWPDLGGGTFTGQSQGPWSVESNGSYVTLAGEFPSVNGKAQAGLTRFAKTSVNRQTMVPKYQTTPNRTITPPTAAPGSSGTAKITFQSAWDVDNENLNYEVFRNYGQPDQKLVGKVTTPSNFWTLPDQTMVDGNAPAGTYTYRVRVTDPQGNVLLSAPSAPVTTVGQPQSVEPSAQFTATPNKLVLSVDGRASADPDGTITSYAWDFGDGQTGTGATAQHTYAAPGTYTVKLTVTDDAGTTGVTTQTVAVAEQNPLPNRPLKRVRP